MPQVACLVDLLHGVMRLEFGGRVETDMEVGHDRCEQDTISLIEIHDLYCDLGADTDRVRTALAAPISIRMHEVFRQRVEHPRRHQVARVRAVGAGVYDRVWRDR